MYFLRLIRPSLVIYAVQSKKLGNRMCSSMAGSTSNVNGVNVAGMRSAYNAEHQTFVEGSLVSKDPFVQFGEWFKIACDTPGTGEANAMVLATASKEGRPSARWVLLKGYDNDGFIFYTNYESRKSRELVDNPFASLVFYWEVLHRSIRIEGKVEKLSEEKSTEYFHSRPKDSQIGACVSNQSRPIASRDVLTKRYEELKDRYSAPEAVVPKPDYWGGFRVVPSSFEFWQGQSNRLHDRIVFRKLQDGEKVDEMILHQGENDWVFERLAP